MTFGTITAVQKYSQNKECILKHKTVNKGIAIAVMPTHYKISKEIMKDEEKNN